MYNQEFIKSNIIYKTFNTTIVIQFNSLSITNKSNKKSFVASLRTLLSVAFVLLTTLSYSQLKINDTLDIRQGTNYASIQSGNMFVDTVNYSWSSFTKDLTNGVATLTLPQYLVPDVISPFANSVVFDPSQVSSVTYNGSSNVITVNFVTPLSAGSTGQLTIKFHYLNGITPNGYAPNITSSINGSNYTDTNGVARGASINTVSVTAIAANNYTVSKSIKAGGAYNDETIYTVSINSNAGPGSLDLKNPVLIDTLPVGGVFVSATAFDGSYPPVYDAASNTITWHWGTDTIISGYNSSAYVAVNYPGTNLGDNVCNHAGLNATIPVLPIGTYAATGSAGSVCESLTAPTAGGACSGGGITAATAYWLDHHVLAGTSCNWFSNGWYNSGNVALDEVDLTYSIDKSVDFSTIKVNPVYDGFDSVATASITVSYATNLNPSFTTLGTYQSNSIASGATPVDHTPTLATGEYITQVHFVVTGSLTIGSKEDLSYCGNVRTAAQGAKDGSAIKEGTYSPASVIGDDGTVIHNISTGTYAFGGNTLPYTSCSDSAEIIFAQPAFHDTYKSVLNSDNNLRASDTVNYQLHTYLGGNDNATSVVIKDTLNTKLDYVAGSSTFIAGTSSSAITPTVTTSAAGNTILTYSLGTLTPGQDYSIDFSAIIHPGTLPQAIWNEFTLTSNNALFTTTSDSVDVTVLSAVALRAYKGQSGCDPNYVYYPTNAVAQEGGPVNYKITVKNLGNVVANNLVLVDVFPFRNDYRGSQWYANLAGAVTISDPSSTVYYTTVTNPCYSDFTPATNPSGCNTPSWSTTAPVDITTATAIKIKRNADLPVLDSIVLTWPMRAPVGVPQGLLMNNSIEFQVNRADNGSQLLPAVPNKVGMYTNCTNSLGSIGDYAWIDTNKNGIQDEPASLGLNGVKVYLYSPGPDGVIGGGDDVLLDSSVTSNDWAGNPGYYKFVELPSGKYYVNFPTNYSKYKITPVSNQATQIDLNSDALPATGNSGLVTINASGSGQDKDNTTIDAGFYPVGSIGNYVWTDTNEDGLQNESTSNGINGVKVYLYAYNNSNAYVVVDSTVTANDASGHPGYYNFVITQNNNYKVLFPTTIGNEVVTTQTTTAQKDGNSDADTITGFSPVIVMNLLSSGKNLNNPTIDAGYHVLGSLGNYVWFDVNDNGLQDEPASNGINGVKVYLYKDNGTGTYILKDSAITANDVNGNPGYYNFPNLYDGNFKVLFPKTIGNYPISDVTVATAKTDGNNDVTQATGFSAIATIISGNGGLDKDNPTIDAGYKTNIGSIGNYVWYDDNNDGLQNEPTSNGVNGVKVYLHKETTPGNYTKFDSTVTANDGFGHPGYYNFGGLYSANYKVSFPTAVGNYPISDITNNASQTDGNNDADKATGFSGIVNINTSSATALDVNNPTIDAGYRRNIGSLGNYVWYDGNIDGLQNEAPANGINGVKVYLYKDNGSGTYLLKDSTVTANNVSGNPGYYNFTYLLSGNYKVLFPLTVNGTPLTVATTTAKTDGNSDANVSTGYSPITAIITSSSNPLDVNNPTIDAGYKPLGSIGNYVWYDYNGDGLQNEPDSEGVNGVKVYLYKDNGTGTFIKFDSTITANNVSGKPGYYSFQYLQGGNYKVLFPTSLGNYPLSANNTAMQVDGNSDADKVTGFSEVVTIAPILGGLDRDNPTIDAGYKTNIGSLGNYVWNDTNGDGINNESSTNGLNNVPVYLYRQTAPGVFTKVDSTLTANKGNNPGYYSFDNLNSGNYQVHFPSTWYGGNITLQDTTAKKDNNSDANATTGITPTVVLNTASQTDALDINNPTIDAGYTNMSPVICNMTASISVNQLAQCLGGNNYVFTGNFTGGTGPYTYLWDFNDGTYGYTQNATHSYAAAGDHDVTLIVKDNRGCQANASTVQIHIAAKPVASFSVSTNSGTGSGYSFSSTSSAGSSSLTYSWTLGNGTTSTLSNPGPIYYAPGTYVVTLIATNDAGCSDTTSKTIVVPAPVCATPVIAGSNTICAGNGSTAVLTSSSADSYQWTYQAFGSHYTYPISGATSQTYTATLPGVYAVFVVNGTCPATRSLDDTVFAAAAANFTYTTTTVANTPCLSGNSISFTNTSVGASTYAWYFDDSLVTTTSTPADTTYTTANTYNVKLVVTNGICKDSMTQPIYIYSCSVSSGSTGGLESKSLGAAIGTRNYNMYKNSKNGAVIYKDEQKIVAPKKGSYGMFGGSSSVSLASLMPYQVNSSYVPYDQSASVSDLESITNAVDVRAIDFTSNNLPKAVAFATKTIGGIYSHTKPICDRLKGAQLLDITNVTIKNLTFIQYKIQQPNGDLEFAISFSVGQKVGRSTLSIQSNWLMPDYVSEDTMFNYQLWAANPVDVATMVSEVLSKLQTSKPLIQLNDNDLPSAYVSAANRQGTTLNLTVNNRTSNTSGFFQLAKRSTENNEATDTVLVPFTISANAKTTVSIPVSDTYDANISMLFNNNTTDMLYMADGIWGTSGDNNTTVSQFSVINKSSRQYASDEYPLLRDVQVQVTTPSYLTIYKYLKGGAASVDLSSYKSFHFTTSTNTEGMSMKVTITKLGVGNWSSQYSYTINNLQDGQTYKLALSDFKSTDGTLPATIDASDITSVVYNLVNTTGQSLNIKAGISNAAFSTEDIAYERSLQVKTVSVSPNPNNGNFKVSFSSPANAQLHLAIVDISGRIISNTLVNAVVGKNEVSVNVGMAAKGGIYFVSLQGAGTKYDSQKMIIK